LACVLVAVVVLAGSELRVMLICMFVAFIELAEDHHARGLDY